MKILLNKCYGSGFNLTNDVVLAFAESIGQPIYAYEQDVDKKSKYNNKLFIYKKVDLYNVQNNRLYYFFTKDFGDYFIEYTDDQRNYEFNLDDRERTNPWLIEIVEKLGYANTTIGHSKLVIKEIPDNAKYVITDYDGIECLYWSLSEIHKE